MQDVCTDILFFGAHVANSLVGRHLLTQIGIMLREPKSNNTHVNTGM